MPERKYCGECEHFKASGDPVDTEIILDSLNNIKKLGEEDSTFKDIYEENMRIYRQVRLFCGYQKCVGGSFATSSTICDCPDEFQLILKKG